ncbi:DoxX family protein [Streptomyces sp. NPDC005393]|uniref:DoxX family protein n=1 Tax=Streptomyces sp. NPDC005393 TaxID=3157041 RepID=UPI0033BE0AE5
MRHADRMAGSGTAGSGGSVNGVNGVSGIGGQPAGVRAAASHYALLPLRLFLGVTFIYAGIDKLTNSAFLADTGAGSIGELMRQVRDSSAVPWLIDQSLKDPTAFGYAMACGELAVGLGTLVGLLSRLAALGGALISLSLWLTVSWQSDPYYYGNDLAYLMAWLPLGLAGAPYLSLDVVLSKRRRRQGSQLFL